MYTYFEYSYGEISYKLIEFIQGREAILLLRYKSEDYSLFRYSSDSYLFLRGTKVFKTAN